MCFRIKVFIQPHEKVSISECVQLNDIDKEKKEIKEENFDLLQKFLQKYVSVI